MNIAQKTYQVLARRLFPGLIAELDKSRMSNASLRAELDEFRDANGNLAIELDGLRDDCARLLRLEPNFVVTDKVNFLLELSKRRFFTDLTMKEDVNSDTVFHIKQFCLCCNKSTEMLVDYQYASSKNGRLIPNWRERVVCPGCLMNNRQRLVAKLAQQYINENSCSSVYLMEQVTPIFTWVTKNCSNLNVFGSEYLGYEYIGGETINNIRHEDVMNLSFESESFDLIMSNDVLEHVPNVEKALAECSRVLNKTGHLILTIPFYKERDKSTVRAELSKTGDVFLLQPAQYHGNPLSDEGCLVFHDFGWDIFEIFRAAGFANARCELYSDNKFGHMGEGQIVFRLYK